MRARSHDIQMMSAEELANEARRQIKAGKYRAAAAACEQLNASFPENDYGWFMTSRVGLVIQDPIAALHAIDRALAISPEKPEWMFQKLRCLGAAGYPREARELAVALAELRFTTPEMSAELAMLLGQLGMPEAAVQHHRRAIELGSENPDHYINLAAAEHTLGNVDEALDAIDKGLEPDPCNAEAQFLRSTLRLQTRQQNHVAELESILDKLSDRPDDEARIRYALTKELEDIGDYGRAFAHLRAGSSLVRSKLNFSLSRDFDTMRAIRENLTADKIANSPPGYINADPIFVVGMPRTGTALVNRILRSHPVVQPVASSQAFADALSSECMRGKVAPPTSISEFVSFAVDADVERVGEKYIQSARPTVNDMAHFVDSLPMNFLYLGFIHLALPKAKIVVLERDPMDTCYFAYRTLFEGAYPFSYDLEEIADFYLEYMAQMAHWQDILPGIMHTVRYEELVSNPVPVIEDLLEYCGLSFDPACMNFWDDEKNVVRGEVQPSSHELFQASIGMWKHYEAELADIRERIGA